MLGLIRICLLVVGSISGLIGFGLLVLPFLSMMTVPDQPLSPEEVHAQVVGTTWAAMIAAPLIWALLILSSICFGSFGVIEAVLFSGRRIEKAMIYSRRRPLDDAPVIEVERQPGRRSGVRSGG